MTYKNKTMIYSFIIRHSFPNLLYVTYLHDVLYVCTSSICFCSPKGTIMKIRSILTCIMLSLSQYLIVKLLDAYIVFCKVVYSFIVSFLLWQINTYLLTYMQPFHMLRRISDLEFALMEKNMSLNLSLVKMPLSNFKDKAYALTQE